MKHLLALLILFLSASAHAGELEFFAGANSTTYDDASSANTWGISLRAQYNFAHEDSGWFVGLNAPGIGLFASQLRGGYLLRSHGDFYWEGGLAGGYSSIFGPEGELIVGFGYHVTQKVFFDFPVTVGTATPLAFFPFIGIEF
jgi:hypothetical protein